MKKLFFITLFLVPIFGCQSDSNYGELHNWYDNEKTNIIENVSQEPDSIQFSSTKKYLKVTYYKEGKKLIHEIRSQDTSLVFVRTRYSSDENIELRNELYENGQLRMEGLVYKEKYYGPWTVWQKDGKLNYTGYRFKDTDFGKWTFYNQYGQVEEIIDKGNSNLIGSILIIK